MSDSVLHWVAIPLAIVLVALLRLWGNRVMDRRRRREAEKDRAAGPGERPPKGKR